MREQRGDSETYRKIEERVDRILKAAKDRERRGQSLALEIDARFRVVDAGAVQFQIASAILEEVAGLNEKEIISELLSLGLSAVLEGATKAAAPAAKEDQDEPRNSADFMARPGTTIH